MSDHLKEHEQQALDALYQRTRLEQPSELLDRRIRQAAHKRAQHKRRQWWWSLPTAAVLVLSISLVIQLQHDESMLEQDLVLPAPPMSTSPITPEPAKPEALLQEKPRSAAPPTVFKKSLQSADRFADKSRERRVLNELAADSVQGKAELEESGAISQSQALSMQRAAPSPIPVAIPRLPQELPGLLALNSGLTGSEESPGKVTINFRGQRILDLEKQGTDSWFSAWPGAEIIGVRVDWAWQPENRGQCETGGEVLSCDLTDSVRAVLVDEKIDHIRWLQK